MAVFNNGHVTVFEGVCSNAVTLQALEWQFQ